MKVVYKKHGNALPVKLMKPTVGILQRRLDANEEDFADDEEYEEFTESAIAATSPLFRKLSSEEQYNLNQMKALADFSKPSHDRSSEFNEPTSQS